MDTVRVARDEYEGLGFDTLPLRPGSKAPYSRAWQKRTPLRLWQNAPDSANIGIRGGGEVLAAFLDCDEKKTVGTFDTAQAWLAGLGYMPGDYPLVATATGGRHVYVTFAGGLPGDSRILSPDFGAGEFRYGPGAYVVASPSQVGDVTYTIINGDFRQLPWLTLNDILPILSNKATTQQPEQESPYIPRRAMALLYGKNVENYKSRSEAEQSLIVSLVNAGHSFESVLSLFLSHPCAGHFTEKHAKSEKNAIRWLRHSYDEAVQWAQSHESKARKTAQAAISWAESTPWPGRTGAVDRRVFVAHAQIAHRAGTLIYAASTRSLAELASTTSYTASTATRRLRAAGRLALQTKAAGDSANIYELKGEWTNPITSQVLLCEEVIGFVQHDAFRKGKGKRGLGKSAGEVYAALLAESLTVGELAERTGRHKRTVKRVLARMADLVDSTTGELVAMVESNDERWHALDVDLDHVARIVGTAGAGEQQRRQHVSERRAHSRSLAAGKQHDEAAS